MATSVYYWMVASCCGGHRVILFVLFDDLGIGCQLGLVFLHLLFDVLNFDIFQLHLLLKMSCEAFLQLILFLIELFLNVILLLVHFINLFLQHLNMEFQLLLNLYVISDFPFIDL